MIELYNLERLNIGLTEFHCTHVNVVKSNKERLSLVYNQCGVIIKYTGE